MNTFPFRAFPRTDELVPGFSVGFLWDTVKVESGSSNGRYLERNYSGTMIFWAGILLLGSAHFSPENSRY